MNNSEIIPSNSINKLEKFIFDELEPALEELIHTHTNGLYSRTWKAKAGTIWVSRVHKTIHQFVLLEGELLVWIDGKETHFEAPYHGITKPGTRRVLYIIQDVTWITFHANPDNLNEDEIVELITEKHNNELFSKEDEMLLKQVRSKIEKSYLTH